MLFSTNIYSQVLTYADVGSGAYKSEIAWFTWATTAFANGIHGPPLNPAPADQHTFTLPASSCRSGTISVNVSNVTSSGAGVPAIQYTAQDLNNWIGNSVFNFYNPSTSTSEALVGRIGNGGATWTFRLTFNMTVNGLTVSPDLIFVDGEASDGTGEQHQAVTNSTTNWSLIEDLGGVNYAASGFGTNTLIITRTVKIPLLPYPSHSPLTLTENATQLTITESNSNPSIGGPQGIAFAVLLPCDHGDAPASYGDAGHAFELTAGNTTGGTPGSPTGLINATGQVILGSLAPDAELALSADDNNQGLRPADEDGVNFSLPASNDIVAAVTVSNNTGANVTLCGWLDVDQSGTFDAGERQCNTALNPSTNFTWVVSSTVTQGYNSRFRVCSIALECNTPVGIAHSGEVEDYVVSYTPTAITIGNIVLQAVSVTDFLTDQGTGMLLALLQGWDAELAASLADADAATIREALQGYLDSDSDGQVALLRWDTLEERGTVGFYVERQTDDGSWTRINNDLLPGLIVAPMGGEYMLVDLGAQSGRKYSYRLIEQEATGDMRYYGPFSLEIDDVLNRP